MIYRIVESGYASEDIPLCRPDFPLFSAIVCFADVIPNISHKTYVPSTALQLGKWRFHENVKKSLQPLNQQRRRSHETSPQHQPIQLPLILCQVNPPPKTPTYSLQITSSISLQILTSNVLSRSSVWLMNQSRTERQDYGIIIICWRRHYGFVETQG